ncbi:MAG: hypothetical protein NTU61_03010 [Candidatus Altiarchaeota archaeon]|nr:hypothetical protein [Candidatus Altiarchaeota archaeon]
MISYADLERAYRLEKDSPVLQKISDNFYSEALELIGSPELSEQKKNLTGLLNEIYDRRKTKVVLHALRSMAEKPPENATSGEALLYKKVLSVLIESRESVLQPPESKPIQKSIEVKMNKVKVLRPLPSIIASDLKEYGPFNGGEVVELPEDNARILVSQGMAEISDSISS